MERSKNSKRKIPLRIRQKSFRLKKRNRREKNYQKKYQKRKKGEGKPKLRLLFLFFFFTEDFSLSKFRNDKSYQKRKFVERNYQKRKKRDFPRTYLHRSLRNPDRSMHLLWKGKTLVPKKEKNENFLYLEQNTLRRYSKH